MVPPAAQAGAKGMADATTASVAGTSVEVKASVGITVGASVAI